VLLFKRQSDRAGGLLQLLSRILKAKNVVGNLKFINGISRVEHVSALWAAAAAGYADCVKALLEAGASPETAVR
jgi:hypothetical protein